MLRRCVCVSFYGQEEYPPDVKITDTFQRYGPIEHIISDKAFEDHLFVEFRCRQAAVQCFKQRFAIFEENGYVVELKDKNYEDQWQYGGKQDPDSPSLMDLNDDCILHLLSYLQEENAVKFVSVRIRGLCKLLWRKQHRFSVGRKFEPCLDRLYHSGDYATHLSVYRMHPCAYEFMFSVCENLKYLGLFNITFWRREKMICGVDDEEYELIDLQMVKNVSSVTELDLHQVNWNDLNVMFRDNSLKLEKLCIRNGHILFNEIPQMSSLTTILLPETWIDIGQVLQRFPQTKALACKLGENFTPIPDNNTLQELFVVILGNCKSDLLNIRRSCKLLRHLRVESHSLLPIVNFLTYGARQFLPLEGLHLSCLDIEESELIEISYLANYLKLFFLVNCTILLVEGNNGTETAYAKVLSKFKKLEITSWDHTHGNIDFFLTNRPTNTPLKIITGCAISPEQKLLSPSCEWVPNCQSVFGPFSIYQNFNDDEDHNDNSSVETTSYEYSDDEIYQSE